MKKLFLLDAFALIYRAHFALSKNPRFTSGGLNTSAIMGFTNTLLEVLKKENPTHMAVVFDTAAPTERHTDFTEYKANRQAMPEDLSTAIPYIVRLIEGFNIPVIFSDGYEADDLIGTLAKKAELEGFTVYCMTPDKDFGQLVSENIFIYGRYFGLSSSFINRKIPELLEFAQLEDKKDTKVEALSGGMKRRLTIARSLVSEPDILMLDEPTTGLDPQARHILWDRLFRLKEQGVTLLITTHYMDEAEQLCDRLIVMDKGKIMAEDSPAQLIKNYSTKEVLEVRFGSDRNQEMVDVLRPLADRIEVLPDRILLYAIDGEQLLEQITAKGIHPNTSLVRRSSLEDVFLRLTGRSLVE